MSSLRRNPVGNARFFTTCRMSHKNVSKFCRSPGGILFSSVSGGFPDVHSSDGYSANVPAKCAQKEDERNIHPVSLFNSLLDPNIELPTISVREVDEILSNLTSENSSPSKPTNGLPSNSTTLNHFCDIPDNLCHDSVRYIKSEAISKPHPFSGKNCSLQSIKVSLINETEGIGHNVANDSSMCINSPQVDRLPVSSNVCHTLVLDSTVSSEARNSFDDLSTLDSPPVQNSCHISSSRHQTIDVKKHGNEIPHKKNNPKTVSLQSMADILPLFPSCRSVAELGALALGSESSGTAAHKHKFSNATLRSKACSGTNLCNISTKASISNVLRDRSPIGSLDLATHARYQNSFNASNIHEASRYRQAYLSVRKANQAKILSKSTVNTVEFSVFNAKSQGNTGNQHVSYQPLKSPQPTAGMEIMSTNRLGCSTGTTSDDRFKHICPHPRCGRRYQAEIGLLRHLVKYHGEQIELPQRTRSVANQQMLRRPASEERTITSIGFNDIDEVDKISPKQSLSKNRTVSLSHSKSFLESNQIEMTKIDFNPSTLPFETIQINEYTSSDELSCDKIKEVTPILDKGLSFVCSTTSNEDGTSVSVPLIDLNTDICPNSFPISVDMDSTNSNDVTIHSLTDETKLPVLMKQPFRKQPRLRSVSGGSHNDLPIIKNTINSINPSDITIQCKHQLSALSNLSTSYITTVNKQKVCKMDNYRRRTLSTGHDPRQVLNMNSDNIDNNHNNNNNDNLSNKCPSCGHIVDWNLCKTKQREWISGVHALSCSKTDCVYCPVDNCTYLCSGRADLSAHLTSIHFPEIQHQLVRLIFACPLKDCQIICSDEASFQAHFTGHLHGHLPGDLNELFNPSSLTTTIGTKILSPTAMTTVTSTPVVVTSTPIVQSLIDNCVDTSSHSLSSNLSYGQTTHCLTDYTTTTLSQSSACDNYHVSLINIQPNLVVGGNNLSGTYEKSPDSDNIHSEATLVTAVAATPTAVDLIPSNHTSSFDNSTESMLLNHQQSASIVSVPSDLNGFSHYCPHQHHHQRQQQPQQHFSMFPSSPLLFPNHEGSITTLSEALKSDTVDNVNNVSNNFTNVGTTETDHVDLTDNRNLLSALDLIPDDILIELLKEDRASLWGDPVTSNNNNNRSNRATNSVLSAPYECNTESSCSIVDNTNNNNINDNYIPIKCVENNEEDYSVNYNPCDTSSIHDSIDDWIDFNVTDSVSRLNSLENLHKRNVSSSNLSDDSNSGGSSSNSSWIPLNLIHHTWSSAIANEKLSNSNYNYNNINLMNDFNQRHFNCPHRVISDLTAALILPDVERRLKASISATHSTTSTNHKNKRNKSNLPSSSTICSSILSSQASSQTTFSAITTGTIKTHQSCCSGKRRRNASESPPLSTYNTTSFNNNNVIKSSLSSSDCWKQSMNNIQAISPNLMKRPYHSKTLISVGNHNDSNNNTSHCLKTTAGVQLDSETLNSKVSNNNNNDKNHNCSTIEQQQQTVGGHYEQNANHNVVKINLTEEQEQEREQQLFVNPTNATTNNNNNSTNLFPTKLRMQHESRKRLKKHQKSSTLTCRTLFTPPSYSIDKYIIPRPVLPRRHSMLASSYNLVVSDYGFTHLPH
ncbi:unnamed protein product [Schistosoma guineensis]|nr:unnamed protein product [Schistosoma guineensis]